jgi:uncharacterized protein (TIGR03435 family)
VKLLSLFALFGLASALLAATKAGDPAPEIHFDKLLPEQPVANARFAALAGKVVVLEMWATWCGPCVGAIPHLSELAEQFKDRPIVFLSVTDEEPAVVEAFLKKRPIGGLVGIAHTESPLQRYGVDGIPATFVIDAAGKIAGSVDPEFLSATMLENLIVGRPLPAINLTIRPHPDRNPVPASRIARNSLMLSLHLRSIVSLLWEIQDSRISGEPLDDALVYDVSLSIPRATPENFRPWARDAIAAAFHIKVNRETRDTEVWILAKTQAKPAALQPTGTISDLTNPGLFPATPPSVGRSLKLVSTDVSFIARFLEPAVGKPIVDETGITGRYDFHVSFGDAGPQECIEAMRNAGFQVETARRTIDFLVVTSAE